MLSSINNLREIARQCRAGQPLSEDLARWLGFSLQQFLTQRCRSVDDALGLRFAQGGVPWWREEAIRARDSVLRALATRFFPSERPSAKAKQIRSLSLRYGASAWRHDCGKDAMPPQYRGTVKEYLWRAFASGAAMPICERQLRNILGG